MGHLRGSHADVYVFVLNYRYVIFVCAALGTQLGGKLAIKCFK